MIAGSKDNRLTIRRAVDDLHEYTESLVDIEFLEIKKRFLVGLRTSLQKHVDRGLCERSDFDRVKSALSEEIRAVFNQDLVKGFSDIIGVVEEFKWGSVMHDAPRKEVEDEDVQVTFADESAGWRNKDIIDPYVYTPQAKEEKNTFEESPFIPPVTRSIRRIGDPVLAPVAIPDDSMSISSIGAQTPKDNFVMRIIKSRSDQPNNLYYCMTAFLNKIVPSAVSGPVAITNEQGTEAWLTARRIRITASNFGTYFKLDSFDPPQKLSKLIEMALFPTDISHLPGIKYGKAMEAEARKEYMRVTGRLVDETGLWTKVETPWLGASPDGIVVDSDAGDRGLLEIKCPYSGSDLTIEEYAAKPASYLKKVNGKFILDRQHNYCFQMQGCMYILECKWCDFVVYTGKDIFIERIYRDQNIINRMVEKLTEFYVRFLLPSLSTVSYLAKTPTFYVLSEEAYRGEFADMAPVSEETFDE